MANGKINGSSPMANSDITPGCGNIIFKQSGKEYYPCYGDTFFANF
jgi:hypothetical protein